MKQIPWKISVKDQLLQLSAERVLIETPGALVWTLIIYPRKRFLIFNELRVLIALETSF